MFHVKPIFKLLFLIISFKTYEQGKIFFKEGNIPQAIEVDSIVFIWTQSQLKNHNLSKKEQDFYYWVNYSRNNPRLFFDSAVTPLVQIYPQLKGENLASLKTDLENSPTLPMFYLNDTLIKMARLHALDITSHNLHPSHNSTNGDSFSERFKQSALEKCGSENISFGTGESDPLFMLVLLYLDINVPELGHRKTLLSTLYTDTGIGISFYKNGNKFVVEDFACRQN